MKKEIEEQLSDMQRLVFTHIEPDMYETHVKYLLAKLEYAEKVLSSIAMETEEDENAPFDEDLIGSPQSVAVRALKAIRE